MTRAFIVILIGIVVPWSDREIEAQILLSDDFEYFRANTGIHSVSPPGGTGVPLSDVWDNVVYWHSSDAIQIVCDGSAASGHCFLVENFESGRQAASELRENAGKAPTTWTPPSEEVWIRHFVRWPTGWEWPRSFYGLKLGRLRTAWSCQPGQPCGESIWGPMHDDPSRIWLTYGYTQDGETWCCKTNLISGKWPGGFKTDRWYCLEVHLRQNTQIAPPNGVMEIYVDGGLVASNYTADTRGSSGPGTFAWSIFNITDNFAGPPHGAAATEKTPSVHFDGVVFSTSRVSCGTTASVPLGSGKN